MQFHGWSFSHQNFPQWDSPSDRDKAEDAGLDSNVTPTRLRLLEGPREPSRGYCSLRYLSQRQINRVNHIRLREEIFLMLPCRS